MNNINKKVVISLFLVISLILILKSFSVSGGTATGSFDIGQSAPDDPTGIQLQDADAGCGGDNWDTSETKNYTTHMLNATLKWAESDTNANNVFTFVCLASTRAKIDVVTSSPEDDATNCDLLNLWNESFSVDDNTTGIRLPNTRDNSTGVDYSGGAKLHFGALMACDKQTTSNRSSIVKFNITLINNIPSVSGFNTSATHDTTPNLGWIYTNDTDDGTGTDKCPKDNVTFGLFVGDVASGDKERVNEPNLATVNYTWTASALAWATTENDGWANQTYYYRINVTDQHTGTVSTNSDGNFQLTDDLPSKPCQFNITKTHDNTPQIAWGCGIETDGDTITYSITAGTTVNGTDLVAYTEQSDNESSNFFSTTIPWNTTANDKYSNTTVFMVIGAYDGASGIKTANYTPSFMLYDTLPDVTDVYMSDNNGLSAYTDCISSSCAFTPVSGGNITLAVNITTNDPDDDCALGSYGNVTLHFCLNSTNLAGCGENTNSNSNYTFTVDSVSKRGTGICEWKFETNLTGSDPLTPEFFISNGNYLYHINATSQSGIRSMISDTQSNGSWVFSSLQSVDFTSSITVGDGTIGFDTWNPGTTPYTMTNYGNTVVYSRWNSTNFTRDEETSKNWSLRGWDFQLDDDNEQNAETSGKIAPVNLTTNYQDAYFNYSTGLQLCITKECNAVSLNETMATYWHIHPPSGLGAGTYSSTITYTITTS